MKALEVFLLIIGVGAYVASFVIPEKKGKNEPGKIGEAEIKKIIEEQMPGAREQIKVEAKEQTEEAVGEIERELEKLSNEKIMAVNEYSDTVIEEIQKNHSEVMFLYSMLNDKEQEIKDTLKVINQAKMESQNFFEKTVNIVNKVDQEFDRMDQELKAFEVRANDTLEGVQAQLEEVRKEPVIIQQPIVPLQQNNAEVLNTVVEEKKVAEETLDATHDEEFEKKLIDTLHSIIPDFDLEEESVEIEPEVFTEPQELVERKVKKSHFNFLKSSERSKNEQVKELYMEGLSEVEIAKKLSIGRGEVRLIIGLMER